MLWTKDLKDLKDHPPRWGGKEYWGGDKAGGRLDPFWGFSFWRTACAKAPGWSMFKEHQGDQRRTQRLTELEEKHAGLRKQNKLDWRCMSRKNSGTWNWLEANRSEAFSVSEGTWFPKKLQIFNSWKLQTTFNPQRKVYSSTFSPNVAKDQGEQWLSAFWEIPTGGTSSPPPQGRGPSWCCLLGCRNGYG